jgi:hypothetical protein
MSPRPPPLAERLLDRALAASRYREDIVGDLHEAYAAVAARRSEVVARLWYVAHALRLAARYSLRIRPAFPNRGHHMDRLAMDLRLAVRSLIKRPLMTATVVLTLALGIGANAAVFGIIDALVLHPYTMRDVDRIVMPVQTVPNEVGKRETVAPANFLDWRRDIEGGSIQDLAAFDCAGAAAARHRDVERSQRHALRHRLAGLRPRWPADVQRGAAGGTICGRREPAPLRPGIGRRSRRAPRRFRRGRRQRVAIGRFEHLAPDRDCRPADSRRNESAGRRLPDRQCGLLRGHENANRRRQAFTSADREDTAPVAIVSQSMARRFWPDGHALGSQLRIGKQPWLTVVGISGDVIHDWFDRRNSPTMYRPIAQSSDDRLMFAVRSGAEPLRLVADVRRALARVDPTQPFFEAMPMRQRVSEKTIGLQYVAGVMATFALLALILAMLGLYAVMTYLVAQRVREIGVRLALGATTRDVTRLALGQAARLTALGLAIGVAVAIALGRLMEAGLLGVVASDLQTPFAVALLLGAAALASSYLPARRAAAVDPMIALRSE